MNITLTPRDEKLVDHLLTSGPYRTRRQVVRAGLRKLAAEAERQPAEAEHFPVGSLRHLFTRERNAEELALLKGSSLLVEHE